MKYFSSSFLWDDNIKMGLKEIRIGIECGLGSSGSR
jgi:hypothetical protein